MGLLTGDTPRDTALAWLFVVVQLALLVAIVLLPSGDAWPVPRWLDLLALALELIGLAVLLVALVNLGRSLTPLPTPVPHGELRETGLYRFVRHPIYTGILALAVGVTIRSASAWVAAATLALAGWFTLKARWEEHHLSRRYPGYAAYAARTPRFVPFWPTRS
jgi:protein-S-isoprenylcysteine O-methyltransferase Ste14